MATKEPVDESASVEEPVVDLTLAEDEVAMLREQALNSGGMAGLPPQSSASTTVSAGLVPPSISSLAGAGGPTLLSGAGSGNLFSALGVPVSAQALVNVIVEQQKLLGQAGVGTAQPAPAFQVFAQQPQPAHGALPVATNTSLRLGAQLSQLQFHREPQNRIDVIQANQLAMQVHQLGMLRQTQLAAAEKKVVLAYSVYTCTVQLCCCD